MVSELRRKKLTKVFNTLDHDGSGVITKQDLELSAQSTAQARGYEAGSAEYQSIYDKSVTKQWNDLTKMDGDGDGKVTLDEFIAYYDKPADDPTLSELITSGGEVLFDVGDSDGDGEISFENFKTMNLLWQSDEAQAEETFRKLDLNGNGSISKQEFLAHVKDFFFSDDPESPGNLILGPV
jgi:Ca2+-binding EF-hand superfamily protein